MIFDLIYFHFQFDQFVSSVVHRAFSIDGLATSHPIYVPVYNPDEINEIFDAISYDKVRNKNKCNFAKTGFLYTVKPVYKGHSRKPENVAFMSSCPLYTLFINKENETAPYRK